MAKVPTQIRIDAGVKKQASELFEELGLGMSTAINIFLKADVYLTASIYFSREFFRSSLFV